MIRPVTRRASPWAARYQRVLQALPWLYFVWAVIAGTVVAGVTPPWQNPDEGAHAERAVQIALGHMLGERVGHDAGGWSNAGVIESRAPVASIPGNVFARVTAAMLAGAGRPHWGPPALELFPNTATYPPFLYAPSVAAVWIGRAGRMRVAATLHLMRVFNLFAAAAVGALALAVAERTRVAIAAVLLLPMSLALAASVSQDALILPVAALAVALIDRQRAQPGAFSGLAGGGLIAVLLLLVLLAKPPYLPLALLLLLPNNRPRAKLWLCVAVAAGTLLWTVYVMARISVPMYHADPPAQARFLLHHPIAFLSVLARSLKTMGDFYLSSTIGVLGSADVWLPRRFLLWAECALLLGLLSAATPEGMRGGWWENRTVLGVAAVLGCALATFVSIYVIWTGPAGIVVEGMQGRYFLPLLPALALAMPNLGRWAAVLRPPALAGVLALAVATPAVMLTAIVSRYYLVP